MVDDLDAILKVLSLLASRWEGMAIQLDMKTHSLPTLDSLSTSNAAMFRMMLQRLQGVSPPLTLHDLVEALSSNTMGQNIFAQELVHKYCHGGRTFCGVVCVCLYVCMCACMCVSLLG